MNLKSIYKYQLNWHHLYWANQDHSVTITLPSLTVLLCFYSIVIPDVKHAAPFFQRCLEVLPFQGLCHIGLFPKVDQFCVQVSPFSKVCFYPNSFPNCSLPLRSFPEVCCGCFPADTLFQMYLRAGSMRCEGLCQAMQSLWRSLSKLLYQLCFFGLPTYLEISTKKFF